MVVGSRAGSLEVSSPASLLNSSFESRSKIKPGLVSPRPAVESPPLHASKVSSVLLPIYAASDAQREDVFKGYDKVTKSSTHKWGLPAWNVSEETKAKFRAPNV